MSTPRGTDFTLIEIRGGDHLRHPRNRAIGGRSTGQGGLERNRFPFEPRPGGRRYVLRNDIVPGLERIDRSCVLVNTVNHTASKATGMPENLTH